jgi:hypothetical protein
LHGRAKNRQRDGYPRRDKRPPGWRPLGRRERRAAPTKNAEIPGFTRLLNYMESRQLALRANWVRSVQKLFVPVQPVLQVRSSRIPLKQGPFFNALVDRCFEKIGFVSSEGIALPQADRSEEARIRNMPEIGFLRKYKSDLAESKAYEKQKSTACLRARLRSEARP